MSNKQFQQQLQAYAAWRLQLIEAVEKYQAWRERYDYQSPEVNESIMNMLDNLRTDRITLAFAAEFSRGKTELINAMFFSDTGVRLLPSSPGRTTMCPTELLYDHDAGSYIRLLGIETRLSDMSLTEYKKHPGSWLQIDLDCDSPAQMQEAFKELVAVKTVNLDDAKKLGLYHEDLHPGQATPPETLEIPCWRHAVISFPHHLLKEGLVILDTPGLNALGTEPELTLNMLPNAQAVVFVLAADTGVTKSDLDMWQNHVRGFRATNKRGLAVVMNKIDSLWDDLSGEEGIEKSINAQVATTASILEIDEDVIFPMSAKQALLAKVKSDPALLEKSRMADLESYLSEEVLTERQHLLVNSVTQGIGFMVNESSNLLSGKISTSQRELEDMRRLDGENEDMTRQLMLETRDEQSRYLANVENFQASRRIFSVQAKMLIDALAPEKTEEIIKRNKKQMIGSMTTIGMKSAMKSVFDELRDMLQNAVDITAETRRLIKAIHKKFQDDHGFKDINLQLFSIKEYQFKLEQLFDEGDSFRNSASSTLMEQGLVVQKLYSSVVAQARELFIKAHKDAGTWSSLVLNPLLHQIKGHKKLIENRLDLLRKINSSKDNLSGSIEQLEQELAPLTKQHDELNEIIAAMHLENADLSDQIDSGGAEDLEAMVASN